MPGPSRRRRPTRSVAALLLVLAAGATACSDSQPTTSASPTPPGSTASPTPTLSPGAAAAALVGQAPRVFDAVYRLRSTAERQPNALVRVRVTPNRYRVDVTRGRKTSTLMTAPAGLVSCQLAAGDRSCLLVAERDGQPPPLFDPGIQRIFRQVVPIVAAARPGVRVMRAGVWRGPRAYGDSQCFEVGGRLSDPGVYCFLVEGRWAGLLARAEFASGSLSLRAVTGRFDAEVAFTPPARPRPLPD